MLLGEVLKKYHISEEDIKRISSKFDALRLKKGEVFCMKGKVSGRLGILQNGLLYAYYESNSKQKVSRFFYPPNNFIVTSFASFDRKAYSKETIEAIEESFLWCISFKDLNQLYLEVPQMNRIGRIQAQDSYIKALDRVHDLQALNKKQRVKKFIEVHPQLRGKVQLQHIASCLGMHRNRLSSFLSEVAIERL